MMTNYIDQIPMPACVVSNDGIVKKANYLIKNVFVYEDGNKIETTITNLDNLSNTLFELIDKYNTNEINLIGNLKFSKGIKEKIENAEMTKYNDNKINIELISN